VRAPDRVVVCQPGEDITAIVDELQAGVRAAGRELTEIGTAGRFGPVKQVTPGIDSRDHLAAGRDAQHSSSDGRGDAAERLRTRGLRPAHQLRRAKTHDD
jgi:hypothetical protein